MTKPEVRKLRLLVILLTILAVTIVLAYRENQPPDPAIVQAEGQKAPLPAAAPADAKIRLDLLERSVDQEVFGKNNLFQYRMSRAPEPPPQQQRPVVPAKPTPVAPQQPAQVVNRMPPPPPPIPLKYVGFAYVEPNSRALIATLMDDSQQQRFNAVVGDIWIGRYRVARITDTLVEVEDLEYKRRQILPLAAQ